VQQPLPFRRLQEGVYTLKPFQGGMDEGLNMWPPEIFLHAVRHTPKHDEHVAQCGSWPGICLAAGLKDNLHLIGTSVSRMKV
jgi:hypothetical protein